MAAAFVAVSAEPAVSEVSALVEAAQRGSREAFAGLYARDARTVHGILRSRIPRADVDDLVQDGFLAAMQQLPSLRDRAAFGGWLAAIARNRAIDYLRRAPKTTELTDQMAPAGGSR